MFVTKYLTNLIIKVKNLSYIYSSFKGGILRGKAVAPLKTASNRSLSECAKLLRAQAKQERITSIVNSLYQIYNINIIE